VGVEMPALGPGRSSVAGLEWLVKVGPASFGAWGVAMGWGERAVYSHAQRLREAGWLETCRRVPGEGTLVYASRAGVRDSGIDAAVVVRAPAKVTWPHCEACAWTAAWLTARGRELIGPRQLLLQSAWRGELHFTERGEARERGHRPDLVIRLPDGAELPIEVELTGKSSARLPAVLTLHREWVLAGKSAGVIYVCGDQEIARRVSTDGQQAGLSVERGTMRVELLETIQQQAIEARPEFTATPWHRIGTVAA
jgi:hypothetical protein